MAQIITNNFNIQNAKEFVSNFRNNYYLVIGKSTNWNNEPTADPIINLPNEEFKYWADSIAAKKIVSADVKQVIRRNDYSTGVVYSQYDHTNANLLTSNFYVLTNQDFNVYKCISNNFGATSTVKPTGRSTSIFQTADGYRWKYMYSLTDSDLLKFYTADYMAVNTNQDVIDTAIKGTLDSIVITNQGNGYSSATSAYIAGNGGNASIISVTRNAANSITTIGFDPLLHGTDYTFANVVITDTIGSNASAYAVISPRTGHGSDPLYELGAKYVMINSRLDYAAGAGDFPVVNDYRRISIVQDPFSNVTGNVATELTLDSTYTLVINSASGLYTIDELIRGDSTNANAIVVSANVVGSNTYIRYVTPPSLQTGNVTFRVGEILRGNSSLRFGNITSITYPEVIHNTGKFLYTENRSKITRQSDQAENIHIVIEF
jgi:hypothetical protein